MLKITKKTANAFAGGLKKFKPVVRTAIKNDFNESDTVTAITDILDGLFGYDKYAELTSEYSIRNTYCDIAVKLSGKIKFLIECKAIGTELKEQHVKQTVDYGINAGYEWVILTNGQHWRLYKILFQKKPVDTELVFEFDFLELQAGNEDDLDMLYAISKFGFQSPQGPALKELYEHKSILNKYVIGQLLLDDSTSQHLRKLLKKISPSIRIDASKISAMLSEDVIKREILDEENIALAKKIIGRKLKPAKRKPPKKHTESPEEAAPEEAIKIEDAEATEQPIAEQTYTLPANVSAEQAREGEPDES